MRWTEENLETLRREYPTVPVAEDLARRLGCTLSALRSKARKLKIVRREFWTAEHVAIVEREYGKTPARDLANRLGRTVRQVYNFADRHGITFQVRAVVDDDFRQTVREFHAMGYSDQETAKLLGCNPHTVGDVRNVLGLPCNSHSERQIEKVREVTRRQCEQAGVANMAEVRRLAYRRFACDSGWPEDLSPRCVQILNLLASVGIPLTRKQICEGIGLAWHGASRSLKSNDPEGSYLAHLLARGLVGVTRGPAILGQGKGRRADIYFLGANALAILQRRAREQERDHGYPTE